MMRRATEVAGIKRLRVGPERRGTRRQVRGVRLPVAILALRPPRMRLEVQALTLCPARTCPPVHAVRLRLFVLTPCPPLPSGEGGRTRRQVQVLTPCPLERASGFRSSPPVPLEHFSRSEFSLPLLPERALQFAPYGSGSLSSPLSPSNAPPGSGPHPLSPSPRCGEGGLSADINPRRVSHYGQ